MTGAIIGIIIVISLYQGHFKYPPLVRKIRKLRKNVKKSKKMKPILVGHREDLIRNSIENTKSILSSELLEQQNNEKLKKEEEK